MRRYFFHQIYGGTRIVDPDGDALPSMEHAQVEAILTARQLVGESLVSGSGPKFGAIQICDGFGLVLDEISFREAIGL